MSKIHGLTCKPKVKMPVLLEGLYRTGSRFTVGSFGATEYMLVWCGNGFSLVSVDTGWWYTTPLKEAGQCHFLTHDQLMEWVPKITKCTDWNPLPKTYTTHHNFNKDHRKLWLKGMH